MITVLTLPAQNGTITASYCERRGIVEFRKGGRKIATEHADRNLNRRDARQIAIRMLSE